MRPGSFINIHLKPVRAPSRPKITVLTSHGVPPASLRVDGPALAQQVRRRRSQVPADNIGVEMATIYTMAAVTVVLSLCRENQT